MNIARKGGEKDMSTRGAIARAHGDGFKGVYHHWDSYPIGLGATLWHIYHAVFKGDLDQMLKALIDDHPAGWSTINGADWGVEAGWEDDYTGPCRVCAEPHWKHYAQYYKEHGLPEPPHPEGNYSVLDHQYQPIPHPKGPQCYCHGERHEEGWEVTDRNAAGSGVEWAYVFNDKHQMLVLSSVNEDGAKMIGMFGCGNNKAKWRIVATVGLNDPEPDWEDIYNYDGQQRGRVAS
jgi:hypothetical protein